MTQVPEAKLVAAVQRGDHAALGDLLTRYQDRLFNVCLRIVGNRDDAAELTQEAMLRVIEHVGSYDGRSAISTWMIRIAMNLSISHLRKQKHRRALSLEAEYGHPGSNGEDQMTTLRRRMEDFREPGPDQSVETSEMIEQLQEALGRLDVDFRAVIVLRDIDGLDYQQIAEVLEVPVGTVKSRLFRARLALREQMLNLYPSERPDSPLTADHNG